MSSQAHRVVLYSVAVLTLGGIAIGCGSNGKHWGEESSTAAGGSASAPGTSFRITTTVAGLGTGALTLTPPSNGGVYGAGTQVTATATPDAGSLFGGWSGDFGGTTNPLSFVIQSDIDLTATFDLATPTASFTTNPDPPSWIAPLTVSFSDTSTNTPTGWAWDFGDGASSSQPNPSHVYANPGTYTVTLTATNGFGSSPPLVQTGLVVVADPSQGSRFWYENDTYGQPLEVHSANESSLAQQVLTLVNQERATASLNPLQYDAEAERAAKAHSEDMEGRGFFDHITPAPEAWDPGDRLTMTGASGYTGFGENIALGQPTAQAVMQAWLNSPPHRANILEPTFTHMGVGIAGSTPYWTQVFLVR